MLTYQNALTRESSHNNDYVKLINDLHHITMVIETQDVSKNPGAFLDKTW